METTDITDKRFEGLVYSKQHQGKKEEPSHKHDQRSAQRLNQEVVNEITTIPRNTFPGDDLKETSRLKQKFAAEFKCLILFETDRVMGR
ncbi:hypothetical protein F511_29566 [Dorcoceras hygrometricum]|uniref:Uncharacterized protein n=1 Tax=Dorcoceras hygrometricum TaxID=472368 RepID=A0A2Z7C428_9LAMI|nr:hypothetical protein F511_29566 [Dorcoceras hygrometricum]